MKKIIILLVLIVIVFLITDVVISQTKEKYDFWGMEILKSEYVNTGFKVFPYTNGSFKYRCEKSQVNEKIQSYCQYFKIFLKFYIYNNDKSPIKLNYFADEYYIMTNNDELHQMEIYDDITNYPQLINPRNNVYIKLKNPGLKKADVKYIVATVNYYTTIIVLKKIPEK